MDCGWSQQTQAAMSVLVVVPLEEGSGPESGVSYRARAIGIVRAIFECLELGFGVRIVVRDVGSSGMGFGDTQIGQQQSQRSGAHGATSIGVQLEFAHLNSRLKNLRKHSVYYIILRLGCQELHK